MKPLAPWLLAPAIAFTAGSLFAQVEAPAVLEGMLLKARTTGTVAIGYRDASIPFSFVAGRGEPIGYSIELCRKLVDAMSLAVGRELQIRWVPVTSESRIDAIVSGKADLECGSTTSNLERRKRVAFSPVIFVAGTRLMVRRGSNIRSFRDLAGKAVVVTAGTTNEQALRELEKKFGVAWRLESFPDHAQSYAQVAQGHADAFATDDVLLYGLIAKAGAGRKYDVVGEFLSYDPYAIMYRRGDPQLAAFVETTFRELADDGEMQRQYRRWFMEPLPFGAALGLPMSPQLETIIRSMAEKPE
jgi:glutamate/aspartate transport system substrate-binding protein